MYNTDKPTRDELPTTPQLIRSTIIAIVAAVAILVTVVLPSEYAIDPTGIGRFLGLSEMGEIKMQLAEEAERDRAGDKKKGREDQSSLIGRAVAMLFISPAHAQAPAGRKDEMTLTLKPGEGAEIKLAMKKGAKAKFNWASEGGTVNFDLHGDGGGAEISYKKGRSVEKDDGVVEAKFDGQHGWFWRNRGKKDVTITLRAEGEYSDIKRML